MLLNYSKYLNSTARRRGRKEAGESGLRDNSTPCNWQIGQKALPCILVALCGLLLVWGCGREEIAADYEPPPVPQFTPRSADTSLIEAGIDAVPEGDYIYLSWLPSPALDLAGYLLYRQAEGSESLELIADQKETEYTDRDPALAPDQQTGLSVGFYYQLRAYDLNGNESGLSEAVYYKLMPKPLLFQPVAQGDTLKLSWSYAQPVLSQVDFFVVKLLQQSGDEWEAFWMQPYSLFEPLEVQCDTALAAGTYRFQVDVVASTVEDRPAGSEAFLEFSVP